jgi:hypothetical protein
MPENSEVDLSVDEDEDESGDSERSKLDHCVELVFEIADFLG